MKRLTNITDNTSVEIGESIRRRDSNVFEASIFVSGNFGGGSITLQVSPDNGTSKINLRNNTNGDVVSISSSDVYNIKLGNGSSLSDHIKLYATLSGSTGASVNINVVDNR